MKSKEYKHYQPNKNDIKDTTGDCVVRALTKVTGKDWLQVFDELVPIARRIQCMQNDKKCYQEYLKQQGFTYHGVSNKKGTTRPTVSSFARKHKQGTFLARVAGHVVAVVDGHFYDTWDCGEKSMYGYWEATAGKEVRND